jgi:hypothetical protein
MKIREGREINSKYVEDSKCLEIFQFSFQSSGHELWVFREPASLFSHVSFSAMLIMENFG